MRLWYFLVVAQGKLDEADTLFARAIAIGEDGLGSDDDPDLASWLNNRGLLLQKKVSTC